MGLYDRDYERERSYYDDRPGFHIRGPLSMTTKLVITMSVVFVLQLITKTSGDWLTRNLSLYPDVFLRPWQLFQLLTYGFLHGDVFHILFNMIGLWFFGRMIENRYGSREFLAFFLISVVFAGLVWVLGELAANGGFESAPSMLGASGGVTAVLILAALNFPNERVLFNFIIPMPLWVLAVIFVVVDSFGAINRSGGVAFTAHLGGAAFGYLYYRYRWQLNRWLPNGDAFKRIVRPGPKLRVHDPEQGDEIERRVNEILKKISDHGEKSLTWSERRFMQKASREYQKRRR